MTVRWRIALKTRRKVEKSLARNIDNYVLHVFHEELWPRGIFDAFREVLDAFREVLDAFREVFDAFREVFKNAFREVIE